MTHKNAILCTYLRLNEHYRKKKTMNKKQLMTKNNMAEIILAFEDPSARAIAVRLQVGFISLVVASVMSTLAVIQL